MATRSGEQARALSEYLHCNGSSDFCMSVSERSSIH
jgi:hypothetical protein